MCFLDSLAEYTDYFPSSCLFILVVQAQDVQQCTSRMHQEDCPGKKNRQVGKCIKRPELMVVKIGKMAVRWRQF